MSKAAVNATIRVRGARNAEMACSDLSDRLVMSLGTNPVARRAASCRLYRRAALTLAEFHATERAERHALDPRRLVNLAAEHACLHAAERLKPEVPTA